MVQPHFVREYLPITFQIVLTHVLMSLSDVSIIEKSSFTHFSTMDKGHTVKLFVGNLALDTTQEELSAIFESYGQVVSCSVLRQFAFVHLQGEGAAERAIRELNGREFKGRNLVVEESRGRPLHSTKVFVGNLSSMCTTEDLQELFQTFGKVLECDKVKGKRVSSSCKNIMQTLLMESYHPSEFSYNPNQIHLNQLNRQVCWTKVGTEVYSKVALQELVWLQPI